MIWIASLIAMLFFANESQAKWSEVKPNVQALSDRSYTSGRHSLQLSSSGWPSGLYFARLSTGSFRATQKLILLR